jgi:hypothetical protein
MDDFSITDELMFRVHGAIERRGFFTMGVMGGPESPPWSYTIGFLEREHPELVTLGLAPEAADQLFTHVAALIDAGTPPVIGRTHRHKWTGLTIGLIDVPSVQWTGDSDLVSGMVTYYGMRGGFPCEPCVAQLVWSDRVGHLPWDSEYDPAVREVQPLLDEVAWDRDAQPGTCGPGCDLWHG